MNLDIFAYLLLQIVNGKNWNPIFRESNNYKNWIASLDLKTCLECKSYHGKIWNINESPDNKPPLHPNCRCLITPMKAIKSGTATNIGLNGADWYIKKYNNVYYGSYISLYCDLFSELMGLIYFFDGFSSYDEYIKKDYKERAKEGNNIILQRVLSDIKRVERIC